VRRAITISSTVAVGLGLTFAVVANASPQADARSDVARARAATVQYHDKATAERDGFSLIGDCVELPDGSAGMGYHYLNFRRVDHRLVVEEPEAVLYAPSGDGGRKLVAIEYVVPDSDQNLATDHDRPTLFGRAFDGPMPGHAPGMPIHYDLHVWAWEANPDGLFNQYNPNVSC
jgi:hypothetical protein